LRLRVREWLEDAASYRLFIEPYLQRVTHEDLELYVRILLAAVNLAKEKYGVVTLIPYNKDPDFLVGTGFSDDEIVHRLQDGGAMVVDVSLPREAADGARGDGHPTPLANRLKASRITSNVTCLGFWSPDCDDRRNRRQSKAKACL
jgi:hypothetical protein